MLGFIVESTQQNHELHWTARTAPEGLIVQVSGQVDAHNESVWQRMLSESAAAVHESSLLIIDAGSLEFMSCGALVALAKQSVDSRQQGVTVRLVIRQPSILRIITECGMDDTVSAHPDLDSALNGHGPP
ncbi:STAS domain-containing protein [Mycolicibacterium nivoides]|uniref:Anti-sigma factor antagonist n=2 Tax=Actinomycetes TaxID=1760 RepID=A0ABW9LEU9_9MYCO|nr:STAS domain-containing protein [Mycolicibacterium nivoides]MBN3509862.1 anti-sigma factor antagonist [Mycolicibacterium septicum]QRY45513.1 anti-sigma factor antagonist [Mycolicibacterium boenickei]SEQ78184.1 anti-anti-sigma factor [Mycobacterium sp. 88mf]SFF59705.1 anti-anti-sigma factor [Mycobacterium sp. 455mf]